MINQTVPEQLNVNQKNDFQQDANSMIPNWLNLIIEKIQMGRQDVSANMHRCLVKVKLDFNLQQFDLAQIRTMSILTAFETFWLCCFCSDSVILKLQPEFHF